SRAAAPATDGRRAPRAARRRGRTRRRQRGRWEAPADEVRSWRSCTTALTPRLSVLARTVEPMRPVTDLQRTVAPLEVVSEYQPAGDQPTAVADLTARLQAGEKDIVL